MKVYKMLDTRNLMRVKCDAKSNQFYLTNFIQHPCKIILGDEGI